MSPGWRQEAAPEPGPRPRLVTASLDLVRRLERFSLRALPASETWELPGWRCLADSGGYVGRVNSATPVPSLADEPAALSEVATSYRQRGLPPKIRWTPEAAATIEAQLNRAGWLSHGEVLVMTRALASQPPLPHQEFAAGSLPAGLELEVAALPTDSWERLYRSGYGAAEGAARARLARQAPAPRGFADARLPAGAGPNAAAATGPLTAGVGLGLTGNGLLGLFDIMVAPALRRRGVATALLTALSDWGRVNGAELAFLQVAADNRPAVELYRRLGFETAYSYVYARPATET